MQEIPPRRTYIFAGVFFVLAQFVTLALSGCSPPTGGESASAPPPELAFVAPTATAAPRSILPIPVGSLASVESTLRLGVDHPDLSTIDPARADTPSEVIAADLLFDGLTTTVAGTSIVLGQMADSWGTRGDDRLWEFVLSQRTWSDGSPVRARDIKASIERAVAAAPNAPFARSISAIAGWQDFVDGRSDQISGIRAVNLATVHVSLDRPVDLPRLLADPHLGVVGPFGLRDHSSRWTVVRQESDRLLLQHDHPEQVEFAHVELISINDSLQLGAALSAGTLDIAAIAGGQEPDLSWRPDFEWIATRADGSFDIESVTLN